MERKKIVVVAEQHCPHRAWRFAGNAYGKPEEEFRRLIGEF